MATPKPTANELTNFLAILGDPGRTVTIEAVDGTVYTVPTVISARRQLELAAVLDQALDDATIASAFATVQNMSQDGVEPIRALLGFVRTMIRSENRDRILATLDRLMTVAYPDLPTPASDHFEVQEVVKALLPFASRLLHAVSIGARPQKGAGEA